MTPSIGEVMVDDFVISCYDWVDDHLPLSYKFYLQKNGVESPLCEGLESTCRPLLPLGAEEDDYTYPISVAILDRHKGATVIEINVKVRYLSSQNKYCR